MAQMPAFNPPSFDTVDACEIPFLPTCSAQNEVHANSDDEPVSTTISKRAPLIKTTTPPKRNASSGLSTINGATPNKQIKPKQALPPLVAKQETKTQKLREMKQAEEEDDYAPSADHVQLLLTKRTQKLPVSPRYVPSETPPSTPIQCIKITRVVNSEETELQHPNKVVDANKKLSQGNSVCASSTPKKKPAQTTTTEATTSIKQPAFALKKTAQPEIVAKKLKVTPQKPAKKSEPRYEDHEEQVEIEQEGAFVEEEQAEKPKLKQKPKQEPKVTHVVEKKPIAKEALKSKEQLQKKRSSNATELQNHVKRAKKVIPEENAYEQSEEAEETDDEIPAPPSTNIKHHVSGQDAELQKILKEAKKRPSGLPRTLNSVYAQLQKSCARHEDVVAQFGVAKKTQRVNTATIKLLI